MLSTLAAWEDEEFGRTRLGLDGAFGKHRPRQAERQRLLPGRRAPVCRHRRAHRGHAGQDAARQRAASNGRPARGLISVCAAGGQGVVAILEAYSMENRGPDDRQVHPVGQPRARQGPGQTARPAAAGRPAALPAGPAADRPGPSWSRGSAPRRRRARCRAAVDWDLDVRRHAVPKEKLGAIILVLDELDAPRRPGAAGADRGRLAARPCARRPGRHRVPRRAPAPAPAAAAARQGVDGLLRSLAKELRAGATGNGILLADGRRHHQPRARWGRCGSSSPAGPPSWTASS